MRKMEKEMKKKNFGIDPPPTATKLLFFLLESPLKKPSFGACIKVRNSAAVSQIENIYKESLRPFLSVPALKTTKFA